MSTICPQRPKRLELYFEMIHCTKIQKPPTQQVVRRLMSAQQCCTTIDAFCMCVCIYQALSCTLEHGLNYAPGTLLKQWRVEEGGCFHPPTQMATIDGHSFVGSYDLLVRVLEQLYYSAPVKHGSDIVAQVVELVVLVCL